MPNKVNEDVPLMERIELIRLLTDIATKGLGDVSALASEKLIEQLKSL